MMFHGHVGDISVKLAWRVKILSQINRIAKEHYPRLIVANVRA